jgi:hypothetical protein
MLSSFSGLLLILLVIEASYTPWLVSSMVYIANKVCNEATTLDKTTKPPKY